MAWGNLGMSGSNIRINFIEAPTQPAAARENTIWVKTDKVVPEWFLSPTRPENPKQGTVWVKTAEPGKATVDLLHRDHIIINVAETRIYNGTEWENAEAHIFQSGKWTEISSAWDGQLYISGDEYTAVTGGWIARGLPSFSGSPTGTPSLRKEPSRMVFDTTPGGSVLYAKNRIDLTDYSRLIFNGKLVDNAGNENYQVFRIWSEFGSNAEENIVRQAKGRNATSLTIDIGDLSGTYIIGLSNYTGQIIVDSIYME